MADTPGTRLREARERSGFKSAKEAAVAMGVPIATYTQHEATGHHLPARRAEDYARFYKVTPEYLNYGRGGVPERIPVFDTFGHPTDRTTAMPPAASSITRALMGTDGDGIAHMGFVAVYNHPQSNHINPDLDGCLCVVTFCDPSDGIRQLIRIVKRGTKEGRFHLIGTGCLPLIDHEVLWMAPVVALLPL